MNTPHTQQGRVMTHTGTRPIETNRLLLRRFEETDAPGMYRNWACDKRVTRWLRWEPHPCEAYSRAILREWAKGYKSNEQYLWAITLKGDGELIGSIGVLRGTEAGQERMWEPGYCIGTAFWGKGYTSEALNAVMNYFMAGTGAAKTDLFCCHANENPASGRVMEKSGFVYERDGVYHKPGGISVPAKYYIYDPR